MTPMDKIDVLIESVLSEGEINWNSAKYLANLLVQLGKDARAAVQNKDLKEAAWMAEKAASYATDLKQLLKLSSATSTVPVVASVSQPIEKKVV
jgi:hypothetical protein